MSNNPYEQYNDWVNCIALNLKLMLGLFLAMIRLKEKYFRHGIHVIYAQKFGSERSKAALKTCEHEHW